MKTDDIHVYSLRHAPLCAAMRLKPGKPNARTQYLLIVRVQRQLGFMHGEWNHLRGIWWEPRMIRCASFRGRHHICACLRGDTAWNLWAARVRLYGVVCCTPDGNTLYILKAGVPTP